MSKLFPVIALTGASGAGKSNIKEIFTGIFDELDISVLYVEGDSFHKYNRVQMENLIKSDNTLTHFSPKANLLKKLENVLSDFGSKGEATVRKYIHSSEEGREHSLSPGNFTAWQQTTRDHSMLFYEGLHGGHSGRDANVLKHIDLLIGIAPVINLEWIQKLHRDIEVRGHSVEHTKNVILARMGDYFKYICPQFSKTDINIQRIPLTDTSNPFDVSEVPKISKSLAIIELKNETKFSCDLIKISEEIKSSFMSSSNTLVVPGLALDTAIKKIFTPIIKTLETH